MKHENQSKNQENFGKENEEKNKVLFLCDRSEKLKIFLNNFTNENEVFLKLSESEQKINSSSNNYKNNNIYLEEEGIKLNSFNLINLYNKIKLIKI
jgi:hypothetical protein